MNRNFSASAHDLSARNSNTRRFLTLIFALVAAFSGLTGATALQAQISPESDALLHRMYASPDFEVKYSARPAGLMTVPFTPQSPPRPP